MPYNTEKVRLAYKSKYNFKHENQVILLMITDDKKWYYRGCEKVYLHYLEEQHQVMLETFTV